MTLSPEVLVPHLGEVLIAAGLITEEQLKQALEEQNRLSKSGKWSRIGEILVDLGYIDRNALSQAITQQILKFQEALLETNRNLEARVAERTAELELAYRKLSELDILKTNFVSNISHELRTPLTHIKGYLDIIMAEDWVLNNPEVSEYLEIVLRSTERLENLINDLITFSIAEAGQMALTIEPFNIVETSMLAISRNLRMALEKNIIIEQSYSHDSIIVDGDKKKIAWVINQLLDNSIKYIRAPGLIKVKIEKTKVKANFQIEDNGPGLETAQIEEAFLPFHQLDGKANREHGGIGIGLTLVKLILEAHNSEIHVESIPSRGSRFSFSLPVTE
jgi:signal transduction histidine kinase